MLEEKQVEVPKAGPQCNGTPGPQKSILDFFKSPGKENSINKTPSSVTEYSEKSPQSSLNKSLIKGKTLEIVQTQTVNYEPVEHEDEIQTSQLTGLCVYYANHSDKKKKKHKKSKRFDRESVKSVDDEVDSDDSFHLEESINNQTVCHSSKKKKSKKEKAEHNKNLDEGGSLCSNGDINKGDGIENVFVQSQDRDCCAISDEVFGDVINSSRKKKHKHKKLRRKGDDRNDIEEMSKDMENVLIAEDSVEINTPNEHFSKHHRTKKEKMNKHESDSFHDESKDENEKDDVIEMKKVCSEEENVSVDVTATDKIDKTPTVLELQDNMENNSKHKKNNQTDVTPKKTGTKRKLEQSFESTCLSDKGHHSSKKSKKNKDKTSVENKEMDVKANGKMVEMSYHDYLQTLICTVDSCNNTVDDSEMSLVTKSPEPDKSETKVVKTKPNNSFSKKCVSENPDVDNEKRIEDNEAKPKDKSTPSIKNFFTKKSESKSNDESSILVVHADIHDVPSVIASVKTCSKEKETSPPVLKSLSCSSPGVMNISDDIEILSSEMCSPKNRNQNTRKHRSWSSSKKKVTKNTATVNTVTLKTSDPSIECENLNKCTPKKKDDPNIKITEVVKKSDLLVKSHKKTKMSIHKKNNLISDDNIQQTEVENSATKIKRNAFLKNTDTVTFPTKTAQAKLSFTKSGLLSNKSSAAKVTQNTRMRNVSNTDAKSQSKRKLKKVSKLSKTQNSCPESELEKTDCVQLLSAKKKKKKSKVTVDDEVEEIKTPERKSQRTQYKVSSLQFDDSDETPIKMKIRFCKSSGGEESDFTPKSLKVSKDKKMDTKRAKAQELLHKAKKHKHKSKLSPKSRKTKKKKKHSKERMEEAVSNDESGRRRSVRLAAHGHQSLEESIIEITEDDVVEVKEIKKQTKSKLSAKPVSSPRTPKQKPSGKLAPIFMKAGKVDESTAVSKLPIDPEKERLRRAFLMSGIPDELKKQTITPVTVAHPEFTPLPTISHVQQKPEKHSLVDVWQLPSVSLSLRDVAPVRLSDFKWSYLEWKPMTCQDSKHVFENFHCHDDISEEVVGKLIDEMKAFNKNYPFADLFKELRTKREDDINSQSPEEQAVVCQEAQIDVAVVDDGVPSKKKKKKKRRKSSCDSEMPGEEKEKKNKLKLKKDEREKSESSVEGTAKTLKPCIKELMWTDRYQPNHSCEVIGHSKNITRIKSWLLEWKHRTHLEERKMRQKLMQQTRGKSAAKDKQSDVWDSDCSDFDIYSDDSEEDDHLCNTLLITGPTGIGKTATVYALAQELGYKVIEVNASSSRNGKRILSQLQEATQSHQVAQSKEGTTPNWLNIAQSNTVQAFQKSQEKPVLKLPTAFTNLFQKATASKVEVIDVDQTVKKHKKSKKSKKEDRTDRCDKTKDGKRKRETDSKDGRSPKKAKKDEANDKLLPSRCQEESSQTGSLNLSSTTLILFDEVDIFFEDFDKGFLPAVQHFMNTTKIPIILTTTDSNFCQQLQTRFEQITFKPPSLNDTVSHLQTLCLVDNVRSDYNDIVRLVRFFHGDIRKCMLALQFWVESGGSCFKQWRAIATSVKVANEDNMLSDNTANSHDTQDSRELLTSFEEDESEFVTIKKSSKSRCRILYDDDSNCNPFPIAMTTNKQDGENLPAVHSIRVERLLGATTMETELEESVRLYLQGSDVESLGLTLQQLRSSSISIVYENILHFIPLPKTHLDLSIDTPTKITAPKKLRRIKNDIYDTEESLESVDDTGEETSKEPKQYETTKQEKVLSLKCLSDFSDFYETMSFIDMLETMNSKCDLDNPVIGDSSRGSLSCGLHVSVVHHENPQWFNQSLTRDVMSELELRSARTLCSNIDSILTKHKMSGMQEIPESLNLPVEKGISQFTVNKNCELRVSSAIRKARENVSMTLPLFLYCQPQVFSLDYLPTLRVITKAEQLRQVAKAKRRFHHHFDHIGLTLKESTMNVLLNTF